MWPLEGLWPYQLRQELQATVAAAPMREGLRLHQQQQGRFEGHAAQTFADTAIMPHDLAIEEALGDMGKNSAARLLSEEELRFFSLSESSLEELISWKLRQALERGETGLFAKFYSSVERSLIQAALELHAGHRAQSSAYLGISRAALRDKMRAYGLVWEEMAGQGQDLSGPVLDLSITFTKDIDLEEAARKAFLFLRRKGSLQPPILENLGRPAGRAIAAAALLYFKGRKGKAAQALGISKAALEARLKPQGKNALQRASV